MENRKTNLITKEKLENYLKITKKAFEIAKKKINKKKKKEADLIIEMVSCYLTDAKYFKTENRVVDAFACINYAHGWIDAGARLGIFNVKNNNLFVIE